MEKKNLKVYETPAMEVVEMELQAMVCVSVGGDDNGGVVTPPVVEDEF